MTIREQKKEQKSNRVDTNKKIIGMRDETNVVLVQKKKIKKSSYFMHISDHKKGVGIDCLRSDIYSLDGSANIVSEILKDTKNNYSRRWVKSMTKTNRCSNRNSVASDLDLVDCSILESSKVDMSELHRCHLEDFILLPKNKHVILQIPDNHSDYVSLEE